MQITAESDMIKLCKHFSEAPDPRGLVETKMFYQVYSHRAWLSLQARRRVALPLRRRYRSLSSASGLCSPLRSSRTVQEAEFVPSALKDSRTPRSEQYAI